MNRAVVAVAGLSPVAEAFRRSFVEGLKPAYEQFWEMSRRVAEHVEQMTIGVPTNARYGVDIPVPELVCITARYLPPESRPGRG